MKRPVGSLINKDRKNGESATMLTRPSEEIARMIDWCLGIELDSRKMKLIQEAFRKCADMECSLNQSVSYIHTNPLILDIVIQEPSQLRDPEVQLAVWASAALLKRRHHKWDTSMPMPAIAINGHRWDYYIFFESNGYLVCWP